MLDSVLDSLLLIWYAAEAEVSEKQREKNQTFEQIHQLECSFCMSLSLLIERQRHG